MIKSYSLKEVIIHSAHLVKTDHVHCISQNKTNTINFTQVGQKAHFRLTLTGK